MYDTTIGGRTAFDKHVTECSIHGKTEGDAFVICCPFAKYILYRTSMSTGAATCDFGMVEETVN